ncbi:MAG: hypothetical protein JSV52_05740 [Candidatus Zixiibacteriota bacterium]|nr:MAG: hypothetical protein JSV52_05740 [candidate division Zixibacteria bacterium]
MLISVRRKVVVLSVLSMMLILISCSDKQAETSDTAPEDTITASADSGKSVQTIRMVVGGIEPEGPENLLPIDPAMFRDWKSATHENFKLLCPQDHAHATSVDGLVRAMHRGMENACRFLAIDMPSQEIVIIYYTGPGQAKEVTGMNYPFYTGDTLHYWPPRHLGLPVMKYLIAKWQQGGTRHEFLAHGLITLLDGSGKNFHRWTLNSYEHNNFIPLSRLAVDTNVNCNHVAKEAAFAASFVDFVVYGYGIDALARLYQSPEPFDNAVENVFDITTDSLQAQWVATLEQAVKILEESE